MTREQGRPKPIPPRDFLEVVLEELESLTDRLRDEITAQQSGRRDDGASQRE